MITVLPDEILLGGDRFTLDGQCGVSMGKTNATLEDQLITAGIMKDWRKVAKKPQKQQTGSVQSKY